jgi:glycosyltransferase involved in cell wall biosynthesis
MTRARVMLAPSLVDGTPNSMFEAMAAGALPIVSPLETIRAVVENDRNVLFARNLYPQEIADALVRAMTDDEFVDAAAQANLELVNRLANRHEIRPRVIQFYEDLCR